MVDGLGSILNFDAGISRVIWDTPVAAGALPDRRQLPPSELAATQQLNRLLQSDNIDAAVARALRPDVGSPDVLRPDRFADALQSAAAVLEKMLPTATEDSKQSLVGLSKVLKEHADLQASLNYYRDMLIGG
jgi:hypothetical protein